MPVFKVGRRSLTVDSRPPIDLEDMIWVPSMVQLTNGNPCES